MARDWMTKFKFSNDHIEYIVWLVKNHMKLHYPGLKKSSLKRLMLDGDIMSLCLLTLVDCLGANGNITEYLKYEDRIKDILSEGTNTRPPPKLTGQDLILAGLKPGPLFKTLLTAAYDHQLEDDSVTKELLLQEALNATRTQIIYKVESGSRLYGTTMPDSDVDYSSVFMPTAYDLFSLQKCDYINESTKPLLKNAGTRQRMSITRNIPLNGMFILFCMETRIYWKFCSARIRLLKTLYLLP